MDELLKREGLKPVLDVLSTYVPSTQEPSNQSTPDSSLVQSPLMTRKIRKKPQLTKVSVQTTDIPPKEIVTYAKQTQTVASPERGAHQVDYYGESLFFVFFHCFIFLAFSCDATCTYVIK
ncbi:putative Cytoplasmic dynein 1 intermediate chain [Daphnia magna]|uniref:Putative Cytoplasmic dynein 1 intermediate chain n=1 Tax=Daphnia magna TaxID=35525 RepID=A0A164FNT7_9CRUS|nr:putative Cytoplasmic dynein 1 intermediate chain [Daphnia magna]